MGNREWARFGQTVVAVLAAAVILWGSWKLWGVFIRMHCNG